MVFSVLSAFSGRQVKCNGVIPLKENMNEIKKYEKTTNNVVKETLENLLQGLTGIAASNKKEIILSVSNIFQNLLAGNRLNAFLFEWNSFVSKGKIKENYQYCEQHKISLLELLKFLENDIADEQRFSFIKKIILVSATEKYSSKDDILPQQYIRIIKDISNVELLILIAAYNASKELNWKDNVTDKKRISDWKNEIIKRSGLIYIEIIDIEVEKLISKNLIIPSDYPDGSGLRLGEYFRMTPLSYNILKFVENYEKEV